MSVKTYDTESYDLAKYFLQDEECLESSKRFNVECHKLALAIQQAVEDWFDDREQTLEKRLGHTDKP